MDTETLAVLVSGIVGVAGVASPLVLDARANARRRAERRDARYDELRDVIDCACEAISRVTQAFPFHDPEMTTRPGRLTQERLAGTLRPIANALQELWLVEHRIGARVTWDDPLRRAFRSVHEALGQTYTYLSDVAHGDAPSGDLIEINDRQAFALAAFYDESARRVGVGRGPTDGQPRTR